MHFQGQVRITPQRDIDPKEAGERKMPLPPLLPCTHVHTHMHVNNQSLGQGKAKQTTYAWRKLYFSQEKKTSCLSRSSFNPLTPIVHFWATLRTRPLSYAHKQRIGVCPIALESAVFKELHHLCSMGIGHSQWELRSVKEAIQSCVR